MPNVIQIDQPKFVTAEVIAARYGVSAQTILRRARANEIPAKKFKNGNRCIWRFDPAAVDKALDSSNDQQQQVG